MKTKRFLQLFLLFSLCSILLCHCNMNDNWFNDNDLSISENGITKGKNPHLDISSETAGNNLSFPVIWAEGVTKTLRGTPDSPPDLQGEWWWWWGTDANGDPLSCQPDPDDSAYCNDGIAESVNVNDPPGADAIRVFLQQDAQNIWQAGTKNGAEPVNIDLIDWGDNLESVDWYTTSKVRTEVVLTKNLDPALLEYQMRHLSGLGINEMWGLSTNGTPTSVETGPGTQATIYSHCARLTIQKLLVNRENLPNASLTWAPETGWTECNEEENWINPPIFNKTVYEGGDGPEYYSAEINVKGKIIYGYTWDVRSLHDVTGPAGDYRITFSFDPSDSNGNLLNTFITSETQILVPEEGEETVDLIILEEPLGGATPELDVLRNLTYIDVRILDRNKGSGKQNGKD